MQVQGGRSREGFGKRCVMRTWDCGVVSTKQDSCADRKTHELTSSTFQPLPV